MPVTVRNLAKELGVPEDNVLEQLSKLYVDAEDGSSKVSDKIAGLLRIKLGGALAGKTPKKKAKKPKAKEKKTEKPKAKEKKTKTEFEKEKAAKKAAKDKESAKLKKAEKSAEAKPAIEKDEPAADSAPKKGKKAFKSAPGIQIIERASDAEAPAKKFKKKSKGRPGKNKPVPIVEIVERGPKARIGGRTYKKAPRFKQSFAIKAAPKLKHTSTRKTRQKIKVQIPISVRDLAPRINIKPNLIIQYLMGEGTAASINQDLDEDLVRSVMEHFDCELELYDTIESMEKEIKTEHLDAGTSKAKRAEQKGTDSRPPVVTFMGHVDHGKTSLLDYIRKTMVTKGEKGGITQHIGAYKVETASGSVTFLDTPGHAAFTAMRARGAHATDVVVLVVAADDGVMPQTKEAIDHARAAGVPIVVAINKCDLPGADPDKVKQELQKEDLAPEDWGGKTVMVEVSAITGDGVDGLVEMLMMESEMLELKANLKLRARGVVIESRKTAGQGVSVTLLVQNGTLHSGDIVLCGSYYGRIKAMNDDRGRRIKEAFPATPVEILGLQGVPEAGEEFFIVKDEKKAKVLASLKQSEGRSKSIAGSQGVTLEDFHNRLVAGSMKELKIIIKTDVQGSVEALTSSLKEIVSDEVGLKIIHSAVGDINESDVMLAMVSDAIIIGFHVKIDPLVEALAKSERVDARHYDVIYEAIADVKAGMEGLLEPEEKEVFTGSAQIIEIFSASKIGKVAGCMITKGTIHRKDNIRIKRSKEVVYEGTISALRRFKDDAKEVKEGFECGISIKNFNNIRKNDVIEAFIIEKIARRLDSKK